MALDKALKGGPRRRYIGQQIGTVMKTTLVVVGAIIAGVALETACFFAAATIAPLADERWVQTVRDVGFPIATAIACGLALRWIGGRLLKTSDRLTDSVIAENERNSRNAARFDRRLRALDRRASKSNELQNEILIQLKDIATRITHQTNVVRSEAAHTADALVKADEERGKENKLSR